MVSINIKNFLKVHETCQCENCKQCTVKNITVIVENFPVFTFTFDSSVGRAVDCSCT